MGKIAGGGDRGGVSGSRVLGFGDGIWGKNPTRATDLILGLNKAPALSSTPFTPPA